MDQQGSNQAPMEMMSEFLVLISSGKMSEALSLSYRIREIEPDNKLIREYITVLKEYVDGGYENNDDDAEEKAGAKGEDGDDDEEDGSDDNEDDDDDGDDDDEDDNNTESEDDS